VPVEAMTESYECKIARHSIQSWFHGRGVRGDRLKKIYIGRSRYSRLVRSKPSQKKQDLGRHLGIRVASEVASSRSRVMCARLRILSKGAAFREGRRRGGGGGGVVGGGRRWCVGGGGGGGGGWGGGGGGGGGGGVGGVVGGGG